MSNNATLEIYPERKHGRLDYERVLLKDGYTYHVGFKGDSIVLEFGSLYKVLGIDELTHMMIDYYVTGDLAYDQEYYCDSCPYLDAYCEANGEEE